ncbi:NAD(P)/FAD-dependent oxidoreductase [Weissella halotolerans]|uniref:Ferredoxin--NADP reductase n=1 Tax=Weissella halotolerans DSM 20190 TaxID=1123500 RepID=A0A0R2FUG3_9LACO|nr:NAD(P)/FAD-dependent oxidoreductase [Weissella halotolerans]KRN31275.1 thioredoxin reductase [Weissella halotolerans DSM 20190]
MEDIIIIGAGPVGLFTGFYAGLRQLKTTILESLPIVGGQVASLYPKKTILDVAGFPAIQGQNLVTCLQDQLNQVGNHLMVDTKVIDIKKIDQGFEVITNRGTWSTKRIIMATGGGAFQPRKLPLDNVKELEKQGLLYAVKDPEAFRRKRVLVAGGGDSALDQALLLEQAGAEVFLTHRRHQFRALEQTVSKVEASSVTQLIPYVITGIVENAEAALEVQLQEFRGTKERTIEVDNVLVSYGFQADQDFTTWSVKLEQARQHLLVNQQMMTTVPGIYAVGDIAGYLGKADLIATGFGEAPTAVNAIVADLYPKQAVPIHSSNLTLNNGQIH